MIIEILREAYLDNLGRSVSLLKRVPAEALHAESSRGNSLEPRSVAAYILRSAASLEQVMGGLTRRLWDDPFEWTLPEALSSAGLIEEYLDEVRTSVNNGFSFFSSDADLQRTVPAPIQIIPIFEVLLSGLCRAAEYQGRAIARFEALGSPEHRGKTS